MISRGRLFCVALIALGLAAPLAVASTARAQEQGQDEVTLKNGGSVRGTLVSSEPGTSVKIIEVGQTQPRVIPWSQVSDVEKGKYAPGSAVQPGPPGPGYGGPTYGPYGPPPGPPPVDQGEPPPRLGDPGVVRLHVESPLPATIVEHRTALVGQIGNYALFLHGERRVCVSPCDAVIDGNRGGVFQLADDDYPSGGPFVLNTMSGDITMKVEPGTKSLRTGGSVMIVLGSIAALTGAVLLPLGLSAKVDDLNTGATVSAPNKGLEYGGVGLLAGGLAILGGGIGMFVAGATHYSFTPTGQPAAKTAAVKPRYWLGEF
jgi:hypothetical protein